MSLPFCPSDAFFPATRAVMLSSKSLCRFSAQHHPGLSSLLGEVVFSAVADRVSLPPSVLTASLWQYTCLCQHVLLQSLRLFIPSDASLRPHQDQPSSFVPGLIPQLSAKIQTYCFASPHSFSCLSDSPTTASCLLLEYKPHGRTFLPGLN